MSYVAHAKANLSLNARCDPARLDFEQGTDWSDEGEAARDLPCYSD